MGISGTEVPIYRTHPGQDIHASFFLDIVTYSVESIDLFNP
jgi:hypothetical protein